MRAIGDFLAENWVRALVVLSVLFISFVFLFQSLNSLTGAQYSTGEAATLAGASSLSVIWDNPVNAAHKLLTWGLSSLQSEWGLLATRVASAIAATATVILFYWVSAHLFSRRIALLGTLLFFGSAFLLHAGRYGEPYIMQMAPLLLLGGVFLYERAYHPTIALYVIAGVFGLALYIPGAIWFVVLGAVLTWPAIRKLVRAHGGLHVWLAALVFVAMALPLTVAGIHDSTILLQAAALPQQVPTWPETLESVKLLGQAIVYRSYLPATQALQGAPLLNITEVILFIAGLIALALTPRLRSNYFILGALALAVLLILLGGGAKIAMLAPFIYLAIATGVFYLLDQWLTVFPRNPIARSLGVIVMTIVVLFSVYFHGRAYYVAWPNAPETQQVLTVQKS